MELTYEDLVVVATIESFEVVNDDYCQYTIRVGLANGNVVPWTVVRRFSDFDALHWALKPLGRPWSDYELPPKRRWIFWDKHNPEFLQERHGLLQQLLNAMLSNPMPPPPLRQFLEVEAHVDLEEMESMVQYGAGGEAGDALLAMQATQEEDRLKAIVEQTANALIDVTSENTDDLLELDELEERRDAILKHITEFLRDERRQQWREAGLEPPNLREGGGGAAAASAGWAAGGVESGEPGFDDFMAFENVRPPQKGRTNKGRKLPVVSAAVATAESLIDTLARPPAVPVAEQERLIETYGLKISDIVRANSTINTALIGDGQDLVTNW